MCEECVNDLVYAGAETGTDDLMSLLASLFGEPEAAVDYLAERGLTSEFDLNGEFDNKPWTVSVAQIPVDAEGEISPFDHTQRWVMQAYYDGELVRSTEGAPPEPVTAQKAAEVYAEFHFDYGV